MRENPKLSLDPNYDSSVNRGLKETRTAITMANWSCQHNLFSNHSAVKQKQNNF